MCGISRRAITPEDNIIDKRREWFGGTRHSSAPHIAAFDLLKLMDSPVKFLIVKEKDYTSLP